MRRSPSPAALAVALALAAAASLSAEGDRMAPGAPHETNLEIGLLPPTAFALPSATDGAIFDLEAQRGERPILLLFFRGTW